MHVLRSFRRLSNVYLLRIYNEKGAICELYFFISPTLPNTFLLLSTFLNKIYSPFSIVTLYFLILYLRILLKSWIHAGITQECFQRTMREFVFKNASQGLFKVSIELVAKNFVLFTLKYKRNYQIFSSPIKGRAQYM